MNRPRPPSPMLRAVAVRIRAAEMVDIHLQAVAKILESLKYDCVKCVPGLVDFPVRIPVEKLTPDQFMAVKQQLTALLCELDAGQSTLEPNARQLDEARKEMERDDTSAR